jgi:hypothetical protein
MLCEIITLCVATPIALTFAVAAFRAKRRKRRELQRWLDALNNATYDITLGWR